MIFNSLTKNVTNNRLFRRKKLKQEREANIDPGKETDSDQKFLTHRVEKPSEKVVDLCQIYLDLPTRENRSSEMDPSPANLCTNSAHISHNSGSPNRGRNKPLFCIQVKEILDFPLQKNESSYNVKVQQTALNIWLFLF